MVSPAGFGYNPAMILRNAFLAASFLVPHSPAETRAEPIPEWVISTWEQLIGTWVTDNGAYKDETDIMDAYGIEWSWGLGRKSLVGRLYGIRDGREVASFWEFREFWHPGEGELVATQFGSDGRYGVGSHVRRTDGSMEMLQTFYDPTTGALSRVGHRSELEGDVHTTRSFDVSDDGVWSDRRTYVWRRKR
jgi:hypothetical protein